MNSVLKVEITRGEIKLDGIVLEGLIRGFSYDASANLHTIKFERFILNENGSIHVVDDEPQVEVIEYIWSFNKEEK